MAVHIERYSPYIVSKVGLIAMTKIFARELKSGNNGVHSCTPGYCCTDLTGGLGNQSASDGAQTMAWLATADLPESGLFYSHSRFACTLCIRMHEKPLRQESPRNPAISAISNKEMKLHHSANVLFSIFSSAALHALEHSMHTKKSHFYPGVTVHGQGSSGLERNAFRISQFASLPSCL